MKKALLVLGSLLLGTALGAPAAAQPFGAWISFTGHPLHGYVQVANARGLNLTAEATIEGWVNVRDALDGGCSSILGKNFMEAYWVGICGTTLRAYFRGAGSQADGGVLPFGRWTHFAVVYGGGRQKHYIDGELVLDVARPVGITTSASALRIGSDVAYMVTPQGAMNELRLWNVARTEAEIRSTINVALTSPRRGLVAVWRDGQHDALGGLDGVVGGTAVVFLTHPVAPNCGTTSSPFLCLQDRFSIHTRFRTGPPGTADAQAPVLPCAAGCSGSGIFYFFNLNNWEIMAKAINGCALNDRWWFFSAATTNVHYRIEVMDVQAGVNKIYFNYPGPPAPAVTDTSAFATCP